MDKFDDNYDWIPQKQNQSLEESLDNTKSDVNSIMYKKTFYDKLYILEVDWMKCYVTYIPVRFDFKLLEDQKKISDYVCEILVVNNPSWIYESSWFVFVCKNKDFTSIQLAYYDSEFEQILINYFSESLLEAFFAVEKFKNPN